MDYVIGSVAALVSGGNVTPNRPKHLKRALTPTKHQPSPNVTPKSEFADDRSIFLSPTLQKKKAIVKKSPKRIFQNPDLDATNEGDDNKEKADKVKKHLKEELDNDKMLIKSPGKQKKAKGVQNKSIEGNSPKANSKNIDEDDGVIENAQMNNENTPKKKKKIKSLVSKSSETVKSDQEEIIIDLNIKEETEGSPKKKKKHNSSISESTVYENIDNVNLKTNSVVSESVQTTPKKKKKRNRNKKSKVKSDQERTSMDLNIKKETEGSPKKKKKHSNSISESTEHENKDNVTLKTNSIVSESVQTTPKKKKKRNRNKKSKLSLQTADVTQNIQKSPDEQDGPQILKKKRKLSETITRELNNIETKEMPSSSAETGNNQQKSKKKNKRLQKSKQSQDTQTDKLIENSLIEKPTDESKPKKKKGNKNAVNPNAVTNEDTDSEHESDNEINSENEEATNEILNNASFNESSNDEDEEKEETKTVTKKGAKKPEGIETNTEEELKRTLFVGNVAYSPKCKKEIKKIFMKYGAIQTIRLRAIPIKDARLTPKVAVIKNELHPERSTVNVYIKYNDAESVDQALVENNTVYKEMHLRVTRSETTGAIHPPKSSVFVGNLPFALEDEGLREKFEKCGEIESVRIIRDKKTNIGKGFGYVNFTSKDAVELALALTEEDLTIKNRILRVKRCTHTDKQTKTRDNTSNNQSMHRGPRDFNNRGRNRGGRGGLSEQRNFNDRGGQGDFNTRGGYRGGRGGQRGGRGGHRGGRGGENFSSGGGQRNFNNRGQDGQMGQGFQQGRTDKNDIGAFRRINNKRQHQELSKDGPPNKRPKNINQPQPAKEKKPRKEFVGVTAEKKKKRKITKSQGLKQRKALTEVLSK